MDPGSEPVRPVFQGESLLRGRLIHSLRSKVIRIVPNKCRCANRHLYPLSAPGPPGSCFSWFLFVLRWVAPLWLSFFPSPPVSPGFCAFSSELLQLESRTMSSEERMSAFSKRKMWPWRSICRGEDWLSNSNTNRAGARQAA